MRIELKSLWRSHLPMGPSLSGKYKKKHFWTFPSEIFGIHFANFLKTPAGASGRYNYHTTTMQKDWSATWNLQRRTNGRDLETKQIPIEETTAILPIGAATYSSLSSSDSLIFFSQVSSSPCSKVFPSSTILPSKTGTRVTAAYRSKSMRRQHMPFSTWRTSRTMKSSCTEVRFFSPVMVYFWYM